MCEIKKTNEWIPGNNGLRRTNGRASTDLLDPSGTSAKAVVSQENSNITRKKQQEQQKNKQISEKKLNKKIEKK